MNDTDFKKLYKKYRGFSLKLAKRLVKDEHAVEDICQEAFISIYDMGEELDLSNERKIYGLVKTVTFNEVKDYYKRAYRRYECAIADIAYDESLKSLSYEIDDLILGIETGNQMKFIFQKLREENEMNYEIYIRVKIYGIPPSSVAKQFHITTNNVNNRIMRTKRWLKEEYLKMTVDEQ